MRREIPAYGAFYGDGDRHWSDQDLLNMLSIRAERGGTRTQYKLRQCPGPSPWVVLTPFGGSNAGAIRGMRDVEGKLFVVAGSALYEITAAGVAIFRGTVPGTARVSMAHNQNGGGNQLVIDNGSSRYVYHTALTTFEKVTDEGFPGSFMTFYVDQYLGFVEPQGRFWGHSDLADALDYNSLDRYEAEADPDRIVAAFVSHREVLIFGKDTIEPFVNAPSDEAGIAPFQRASNTVIECGCAAKYAVAGMDNSVFWLDDKRIVRRLDGYTPVRISNAGIEQALAECTATQISRAYAFTWEDQGHKVYYLTVPGVFTFGYDLLSGEWHRRSSPGRATWRFSDLVFWNGQWIGGDSLTGHLYTLDWDYFYDGLEELVREWTPGVLANEQRRIEINELEVLCSVGGQTCDLGSFPAQPEGPTITGDCPNGIVGDPYSFTYTLADGTPPYRVELRTGTLPAGTALSSAGVLSGTPTAVGDSPFTLRVIDANGLYDDHADSLAVTTSPVMLATNRTTYDDDRAALTVGASMGWDGTIDRIALSPDGLYAAGGDRASVDVPYIEIRKYDVAAETWSVLADPDEIPDLGPTWFAWSPDGNYLAATTASATADDRLFVWKRDGDTFTRVAPPADALPASADFVCWDDDGLQLAIGGTGTGNAVVLYDFDPATDTIDNRRYINTAAYGTTWIRLAWKPGSAPRYLAAGSSGSSNDFVVMDTTLLDVAVGIDPCDASLGVHWSADGTHIYTVGADSGTYAQTYTFGGAVGSEALVLVGNFATQPSSLPVDSALSPDHLYLAIAVQLQNYPSIYSLATPAAPAILANPATAGGSVSTVSWSEQGE